MNHPHFSAENRKSGRAITRYMRILALMANGEPMTCPRAQKVLGGSIQTARNIVCALVTQKVAYQITPKGRNFSATYGITEAGRQRVLSLQPTRPIDTSDESDAEELAERAAARARIDSDLAWARAKVPKSVFDLGGAGLDGSSRARETAVWP